MYKALAITLLFVIPFSYAHARKHNWQLLSHKKNHVYGMSVEEAYKKLGNRPSKKIIVAVIDGGVDTNQEDLKGIIWTNTKEIPGNGIDDDGNGYADDVHGWDFIGGKNGDLEYEAEEKTRTYQKYVRKFKGVDTAHLSAEDSKEFETYKKLRTKYEKAQKHRENEARGMVILYKADKKWLWRQILHLAGGKDIDGQIAEEKEVEVNAVPYNKMDADSMRASIIGDHPEDMCERYYGNNDVSGPDALHGTHVSGIIAAIRHNHIGMDGIANNVLIMPIRTVPSGDERDKDVANAIRYAVDNGASVINMSFGKYESPNKGSVDSAVAYASSKDVLIVCASGNDSKNIDTIPSYPNPRYLSGGVADNWIEVGASGKKSRRLIASFSNWGEKTVDMFAPGVRIYSTLPGNKYGKEDGTSMAAPMVTGVAAMIRSYFPELKASEVKAVLMKTVTHYDGVVHVPGHVALYAKLDQLCVSGGIVNAEAAVDELIAVVK